MQMLPYTLCCRMGLWVIKWVYGSLNETNKKKSETKLRLIRNLHFGLKDYLKDTKASDLLMRQGSVSSSMPHTSSLGLPLLSPFSWPMTMSNI